MIFAAAPPSQQEAGRGLEVLTKNKPGTSPRSGHPHLLNGDAIGAEGDAVPIRLIATQVNIVATDGKLRGTVAVTTVTTDLILDPRNHKPTALAAVTTSYIASTVVRDQIRVAGNGKGCQAVALGDVPIDRISRASDLQTKSLTTIPQKVPIIQA